MSVKVLVVLLVVVLLAIGAVGLSLLDGSQDPVVQETPKPQFMEPVQNRFIDVNGDGLVDWVYQAEVVINRGNEPNAPLMVFPTPTQEAGYPVPLP